MNFEMKIFDVFHLQSGQTVFAGYVTGTKNLIENSKAKLSIDGKISQIVEIEGEFIMNVRHPYGHRAISTIELVDLTSEFVKKHECILGGVISN
ncbi:MAG: hypothetical protein ACRC2R_11275 [Xenococcaceae cyanobacterium]